MNNLYFNIKSEFGKFCILFCLVFASTIIGFDAYAQNTDRSGSNKIALKAMVFGDTVKLRWMPSNIDIWRAGAGDGYRIIRMEIDDSLPFEEKLASAVVISESVRVWSESEFEYRFAQSDSVALAARYILYDPELIYQPSEELTLQDAINIQKNEEGRFFFFLMLAEQSYEVAEALGLAYTDLTASPDKNYQYFVSLSDRSSLNSNYLIGVANVNMNLGSGLPAPTGLTAIAGDRHVVLGWQTKGIDDHYTYYNIERRTALTDFEVVNKNPFLYMSDESGEHDFAFYTDSLNDNTTEYIYRVVGITSFGSLGPPSDTVRARGKEPLLEVSISVTDITIGDDFAVLKWSVYPDSLINRITRLDILRSINLKDSMVMVNGTPLIAEDTTYLINSPPEVAYYVVQATDDNEYIYQSIPVMIQLADTIPPAKPVGLTGRIRRDGLVSIEWTPNTEPDLKGYKVLFSNSYNGEYSQLTSVHLIEPFFETYIDPQFMADSIYYRVFAIDHRFNMSEWSDPLSLQRPDVVAPSQSVINDLIAFNKGIAVYWSLSASKDVAKFELQRRISGTPQWTTILAFSPEDVPVLAMAGGAGVPPANFLDMDQLSLTFYSYRIMAVDFSGNKSYSVEKQVFPFDSGLRGKIYGFMGFFIPYMPVSDYINLTMNPSFFNTIGGNPGSGVSPVAIDLLSSNTNVFQPPNGGNYDLHSYKKAAAFRWKYATEYNNIRSFKLYRRIVFQSSVSSVSGSAGSSNYSGNNSFVLVASVDPESAARLAQTAGFTDSYIFVDELPQRGALHYEYKLRAEHSDGGFSQDSPIVIIQTLGN